MSFLNVIILILSYPDFSHPFLLYTDSSQTAISFILGQSVAGVEKVVSYGGRTLTKHELNYSTFEKEALAIVAGIKKYKPQYKKYKKNNKI